MHPHLCCFIACSLHFVAVVAVPEVHNGTSATCLRKMQCCQIRNTLAKYISSKGSLREETCTPEKCPLDQEVKRFSFAEIGLLKDTRQDFHLDINSISDETLSELVVLAFMGKFVTKQQLGEEDLHKVLVYDTISHQITTEMPQCEFHENMYQIMIAVSILAIISIMLLQTVHEIEEKSTQEQIQEIPVSTVKQKSACTIRFR
jgi:hypothetical protein